MPTTERGYSQRHRARSFEEYLTLLATEVALFGASKVHAHDESKSLLIGFTGPSGWTTVPINAIRTWAGAPPFQDPAAKAETVRKIGAAIKAARLGFVLPASAF